MEKINRLDENSESIQYLCQKDKHLAKVIKMIGPLEYRNVENGYAFLTSQIIGQMLSNKVADIMFARLTKLCDGEVTVDTIAKLTDEQIRSIGISHPKVKYIRNLTVAVNNGDVDFEAYQTMDNDSVIKSLTSVKGIGTWSAKMYLIFSLNRPDILPFEDIAFLQGYSWVYKTDDYKKKAVEKKCKKWGHYSSIAARYMYRALDMGLTKEPFHLYK